MCRASDSSERQRGDRFPLGLFGRLGVNAHRQSQRGKADAQRVNVNAAAWVRSFDLGLFADRIEPLKQVVAKGRVGSPIERGISFLSGSDRVRTRVGCAPPGEPIAETRPLDPPKDNRCRLD